MIREKGENKNNRWESERRNQITDEAECKLHLHQNTAENGLKHLKHRNSENVPQTRLPISTPKHTSENILRRLKLEYIADGDTHNQQTIANNNGHLTKLI